MDTGGLFCNLEIMDFFVYNESFCWFFVNGSFEFWNKI